MVPVSETGAPNHQEVLWGCWLFLDFYYAALTCPQKIRWEQQEGVSAATGGFFCRRPGGPIRRVSSRWEFVNSSFQKIVRAASQQPLGS